MFKSLYSKLAAVLAGLFCLVGLCFVGVTVFATRMYQQEVNQKLNALLAQQIVSEKLLMQNNRVNRAALNELFHMLMVINPAIEIYLLDPDGRILAFSAPPGKVLRRRVDLTPIRRWFSDNARIPLQGDDPRDLKATKVFSVARIPEKGQLEGYLYVILGGEAYDGVVQKIRGSYIIQLSSWMILASIVFAFMTGLVLFALLTGRLKRLARVMETFKAGRGFEAVTIAAQAPAKSTDEIDVLVSTFKHMADRIQNQMVQLKQSDAVRRELMTNVSHDLRTPLATLQGYIETLLMKNDVLGKTERQHYLHIAIRHCERLNILVGELLELAKLESPEIKIHPEPFNLGELVQDVTQKFGLKAQKKNIAIATHVPPGCVFVSADIGMIERVIENLLENAIHFAPTGESVDITLKLEGTDVSVLVSDTGMGIAAEELPFIFDRFYQSDKDRSEDSDRGGLGLAIAKRILDLHHRSIRVKSRLNSGTTFAFKLPATGPTV